MCVCVRVFGHARACKVTVRGIAVFCVSAEHATMLNMLYTRVRGGVRSQRGRHNQDYHAAMLHARVRPAIALAARDHRKYP